MVLTLRYLSALAGASLAVTTPPARCKEHRSSGMEKLRMQQHRDSPHSPDVGHLLSSPPPLLGTAKAAEWNVRNMMTALQIRLNLLNAAKLEDKSGEGKKRKRVVVAGGGWASASFIDWLDPKQFEVVWISPQQHFTFTALLPAVCGGSLPVSAVTAKLRDLLTFGGDAKIRGRCHLAFIDSVDLNNKKVTCRPADSPGGPGAPAGATWEESYDYLVLAVGSDVNTFNTRGVKEHALFLRTAEDAQRVRARIGACLEKAAHPTTPEEMRERLLTFVVVGAGPSGVEAAAEITEYLNSEGRRLYPHISKHFRVVVLEMGPKVLPMYNEKVQKGAKQAFKESGIELQLNSQVIQVSPGAVTIKRLAAPTATTATPTGAPTASTSAGATSAGATTSGAAASSVETIKSDFVLWASGVRPTVLATTIAKGLAAQIRPQRLLVDPSLRVLGTDGIFALGDCCTIAPPLMADHAEQLFELAVNEHKPGHAGTDWLQANGQRLSSIFPQAHPKWNKRQNLPSRNNLDLQQFTELLKEVDKRYISPAPTAQNARQEGKFLALLFNSYLGSKASSASDSVTPEVPDTLPGFVDTWKGSLCFLGNGTAALELPFGTFVGGFPATVVWKLVYLSLQVNLRAACRCVESWIESSVFGRDITCTIPPPPKGTLSDL